MAAEACSALLQEDTGWIQLIHQLNGRRKPLCSSQSSADCASASRLPHPPPPGLHSPSDGRMDEDMKAFLLGARAQCENTAKPHLGRAHTHAHRRTPFLHTHFQMEM